MKRILIFVLGLGCSETNLTSIQMELQRFFRIQCVVMCNKSIQKTLRNIGKTVCYLPPSKKSAFVNEVFYEVINYANRDYNVIVVGHSYGGSVVSRVAELFTDRRITRKNVQMITTGSIYVPKPLLTRSVNIRHIMFTNDVALRCNHLNPIHDTYVEWLKHKKYKNYEPKFFNIFGSGTEWEIHNDYIDIIYNILKTKNTNKLNAAERSLSRVGIRNKLKSYIGGGVNGHVFETNKGNLIKMISGNNPMEYEGLRIMEGSGITPKLKKFNGKDFSGKVFKNIRNKNLQNLFKRRVNKLTVFKMNKINANKIMTMYNYAKSKPDFDWKNERKRLLNVIHSRGLTHGDLHLNNILVSLTKNKPPRFWAIDFGRSVRLPAGVTEKSLFNTGYYGSYYGIHAKRKTYQTKSNRLVKPNYQMHNNLSKANTERAKKYKYLPNLNYMRKFGVVPLKINNKEPLQVYRKRTIVTKEPRLRKFNAPRIKQQIIIKNVNLKNYSKIYKNIRNKTNVPGAYNLRKKMLSNLEKELVVHDYIAANNFKPYETKNYYYMKYGRDPKHWLFLLPESYERLKKSVGNSSFNHFILRNKKILLKNFKRVSK